MKFLYTIIITILLATILVAQSGKKEYEDKLTKRLELIIMKEYSIPKVQDIWLGVVNYPQWFINLSMGNYNGLTFNGLIKGSESLYPTNITQERWMFNFNSSSKADTESCSQRIKGWTKDERLELVMYSQMMNICLSSDFSIYKDDEIWYNKCWVKYHKNCNYKG